MNPFEYEGEARQAHSAGPINQHKILVKVRADHNTDGTIRPLAFLTPDGQKVVIDKVLGLRQAASLKAGGQGMRYEIRVSCGEQGRTMYLFDDDGIWFIERDEEG